MFAVTGWSHQPPPNGRPNFGHHRSLSSILRSASPRPSAAHARSSSTTELTTTADSTRFLSTSLVPRRPFEPMPLDDENDLSTIPDPRSRAMSPADGDSTAASHHPDLSDEVATLSTKLINAINHQTTLDDNLSAARLELEKSRARIRELEAKVEEQREMLEGDVWVRRASVEAESAELRARAAEEKRARLDMEQQKKKIEQELENLTAALFEEANKMVISAKEDARAEQEALQRKNDQLRAQLADTEALLRSQQEQLAELKHVMEQMAVEREEQVPPTLPSSPGGENFEARDGTGSSAAGHHHSLSMYSSPSYPTSFTHLLHPVLRTDLAAYNEFRELLRTTKRLSAPRAPPTASSGSGLTSLAIGLGSVTSHVVPGNGSTSSLPTTGTPPTASPQTPHTPASSVSSISSTSTTAIPPLKETKFYKRVLIEDIEPTLRLDAAPGLSWLARRSVLAAMTDGSLVVEPTPPTATGRFGKVIKPQLNPCSLCGEARKDEEFLRTHRFRVSESDSTQVGYPLCRYCLGRVRSTCEFLGFLRIVKDGHWRADDEDAEKAAWEESVRLREQMFWSRIGGGVVPTGHTRHPSSSSVSPSMRGEKSPRPSHESAQRPGESPKQFLKLPNASEQEDPHDAVGATEAAQQTAVADASQPSDAREVYKEARAPVTEEAAEISQPEAVDNAAETAPQPTDHAGDEKPSTNKENAEEVPIETSTAAHVADSAVEQSTTTTTTTTAIDAETVQNKSVSLAAPVTLSF
ncbi:hypothetical protein VTH82DRAFT_7730 [Thermothelomyces myriococcoides]